MAAIRVAFVTRFPYTDDDAFSGLLQVSRHLCDALGRRDDLELTVVSGTSHIRRSELRQMDGYKVVFLPFPPNALHYGSCYLLAADALRRAVLHLRPDLVHCQATSETVMGGLLSGLPMVTTIHGIYSLEAQTFSGVKTRLVARIQTLLEHWYVPRLRYVIASSPYVERFVRGHNPTAIIAETTNPIDPCFFSVDIAQCRPAPRTVLLVGIVAYRKGHDLMIDALETLLGRFPDLRLTVVGKAVDLAFEAEVRQRVGDRGLSDKVRWLGPISQEDLLEEMRRHQIVCLPSREDTRPTVLLQAMAVGNICVASDAGGIPDMIVDGRQGFLFRSGDAAALSRALATALTAPPELLEEMRHENRAFAEGAFAPATVAAQTAAIYRQVLAGWKGVS